MLKMNIPRGRKLAYFGIGIAGTIIVNMIRIFSLSWYALKVTANPVAWEEYHKIAGEIMFLPWLFAFILVVVLIESRRIKRMEGARQQAMSDNDAAATGGGDSDGVAGDDGTAAARSGVGDGGDDDDNNNARDIADTKDGASAAAGMELADPAQNSNGRKDA